MKFAHFCQVFPRKGETTAERYEQLWRELQLCDEVGVRLRLHVGTPFRETAPASSCLLCSGRG